MNKTLDHCPYCKRRYSEEEFLKRVEAKKENARASNRKAVLNGNCGRPKANIDWLLAKNLRDKYFTQAKIAKELGVSRTVVSREFKKRGWK